MTVMEKVVICGWVCPVCVDMFDWEEDRVLPNGHVQSCENCCIEYVGDGWIK